MRRFVAGAARAAGFMAGGLAGTSAAECVFNFYNWSDNVDSAGLKAFTATTGIKVHYGHTIPNETLETKLRAGHAGYDMVVPTSNFLQREIKAGVFQKLDKSKLPNLKNVCPTIAKGLAVYEPGNQYAVDHMWGTTGIDVNVKAVHKQLGPTAKIDRWDAVHKPEILAKFKERAIEMLDSPNDIIPAALNSLGLDSRSTKPADLERANQLLMKIRPSVLKFHFSEYIKALAIGDICFAVGWSGDSLQAKNCAKEAVNG